MFLDGISDLERDRAAHQRHCTNERCHHSVQAFYPMGPESREEVAVASGQTISVCNMAEPETAAAVIRITGATFAYSRLLTQIEQILVPAKMGRQKCYGTIGLSHSTAVTGIEDAKRLSFDDPYCSVRG